MKFLSTYFFNSKNKNITVFSVLICIPLIFLINKNGINTGLVLIGIMIAFIVGILSFYNYKIGIYIITLLGFMIFTMNRIIDSDIPFGTVVELLIIITTISMLVYQKFKNNNLSIFFKNPFVIIFSIYIIYVIFSLMNPAIDSIIGSIIEIKRFISLYCFFLLIYIGLDNIKEYSNYSKILITLFIVSAIYGCYQQIFGFTDFEMNYIMKSENRRNLYFLISGIKRKFSIFSDPSSFGITMASVACILLCIITSTRFTKYSIINCFFLIFTLMAMVFSGTRTAYLAFIAGTCFLLLLTINNITTRILGIILLLGFAFLMILPIYSNPALNRFRSAFEFSNEESLNVRDINRKSVQPYMFVHPFGGGLGTTSGNGKKYNPNHYLAGFETDSGYLKTSTELGWIGLILLLFLYYSILNEGLNIYFNSDKKITKLLVSCSLVCIFTFIFSQYAQVAIGQFPDSFLFYAAAAIICKLSLNFSKIN